MAINVDNLLGNLRKMSFKGLLEVKKGSLGEEAEGKQDVAIIELLRIGGAIANDSSKRITMVVGDHREDADFDDLQFIVPNVGKFQPGDIGLTVFMDANWRCGFGGHKWDCRDGEVRFTYRMPLPPGLENWPDTVTLQRVVSEIYQGLLFYEYKILEGRIDADEFLSDEDKKARQVRIEEIFSILPAPDRGEAV